MGFIQTDTDLCVYETSGGDAFFLGIYVDDIVLATQNSTRLMKVKRELAQWFDIKDMGKLYHFLRMKIVQDEATSSAWIVLVNKPACMLVINSVRDRVASV